MRMVTVRNHVSAKELEKLAKELFGNLVKAVVDVEKEVMAIGGELHADAEALLIQNGSKQKHLWGINLYPELSEDWVEFDSMINLRPSQNNHSRAVESPELQETIKVIVNKLVKR